MGWLSRGRRSLGKASLLLRIEAVETAGAALNATPDEPERAVRKVLSFD
jgi:hypothetical protein